MRCSNGYGKDVPDEYCCAPICTLTHLCGTDGLGAYQRFFAGTDHEVCDKGSGKTSIVEAMNTKWRQRQSGLVRRSCGVWYGIEQDITERFMILLEMHNKERIRRWMKRQKLYATAKGSP